MNNLFVGLEMMTNRSAIRSNLEGIASGLTGVEIIELYEEQVKISEEYSKSKNEEDKKRLRDALGDVLSKITTMNTIA
mgnify:CR=1 FL=1